MIYRLVHTREVLADRGSSDGSLEIAEEIEDVTRIVALRNERIAGTESDKGRLRGIWDDKGNNAIDIRANDTMYERTRLFSSMKFSIYLSIKKIQIKIKIVEVL